jgi:hypothetical protein
MSSKNPVTQSFEFFREEFGVKLIYVTRKSRKTGKITRTRDIRFYKPSGEFIYKFEGINIRDAFRDAKGKARFPSDYKKIKETIYKALPQFFRTQYVFLYYAHEIDFPNTPKPFAEMRVFVYHKIPNEYKASPQLADIEEHLSFLASEDAGRNHRDWQFTINWDYSQMFTAEEQDTPLTPEDMKDEARALPSGLIVGGIKALNYVHRHVLYLTKKGKGDVKAEYMENYWQNSELKHLNKPLQNKLHHIQGRLIHHNMPRTYKPKYPLWRGVSWQ